MAFPKLLKNFAIMGIGGRQDLVNISKKYQQLKETDEVLKFLSETSALDSLESFKNEFSSLIRSKGLEKIQFFNEISKLFVKPKFKREDRVEFIEKLYEQSKKYYEMKKNVPLKDNFSFLGLEQETDLEKLKEIYNNYTLSRTTVSNKTKKQIDSIVKKLVKLAKAYPEEVDFLKFRRSITVKYGDKEFTTPEKEYVLGQRVNGEDPSKSKLLKDEKRAIDKIVSKTQRKKYALVDIEGKNQGFDATVNFTYSDYYQALKDDKRKIDLNLGLDVELTMPARYEYSDIYTLFVLAKQLKKNIKPVFDILFPEKIGKDFTDYALKDPKNMNSAFVSLFYQNNGEVGRVEKWLKENIQSPRIGEQVFFDRTQTVETLQGRTSRPRIKEDLDVEEERISDARRESLRTFEDIYLYPDDKEFEEFFDRYKDNKRVQFLGKKDGKQFVRLKSFEPYNYVRPFKHWSEEKIEEYSNVEEFEPIGMEESQLPEPDLFLTVKKYLTEENFDKYYGLSDISNLSSNSSEDFFFSALLLVDHFIKDNTEDSEKLSTIISSDPEALSDESSSLQKRVQDLLDDLKEGLVKLFDETIDEFYNHIKNNLENPNNVSTLLSQEKLLNRLTTNNIILIDSIEVEEET